MSCTVPSIGIVLQIPTVQLDTSSCARESVLMIAPSYCQLDSQTNSVKLDLQLLPVQPPEAAAYAP
jgi:hypothetical protein